VATEHFLDALSPGASDALVDRERVPQVRGGFGRVAVPEVASADSFQRACFRKGDADLAGDGKRLGMPFAGLAGDRGLGG
jgi:hypothetical protein